MNQQYGIDQFHLLEHLTCPVALVDSDLVVQFANSAFDQKIGGFVPGAHLLDLIHNVSAAERSFEAASNISSPIPLRLEPVHEEEAMLCVLRVLPFAAKEMFLIQASQTDVNRYFKLNREVESMASAYSRERRVAQEHENTCKAIEAFVEMLVHDIRSPLATVVQGMDLLPDELESENVDQCRSIIEQLRLSSSRLVEFVDSLYEHSQMHRAKLIVESVELGRMINVLQEDLSAILNEAQGELIIKTKLPIVRADRQLLRQLLQNLLQNSVKYRSPDRRLQITVGCARIDDSNLELYIEDNGRGFPPEQAKEIFAPYKRSESGGLGIGLATCKSIADKHAWTIRAEGREGQGAKFTVRIGSWC